MSSSNSKLAGLIESADAVVAEHAGVRLNGKVASLRTQTYSRELIRETCRRLHGLGYFITNVNQLQGKHIEATVESWHAQGLGNKTMQNQFSRLKIFCAWMGKPGIVKPGGVKDYLPEVAPETLKVRTYAVESKSWSANGVSISGKIQEALLEDQRLGAMLMLGIAFGLRKKEMLRIKPWKADKGVSLDIDGSVAKNGRFRSITLQDGDFGVSQRWALDVAKRLCKKTETLGWPGLTIKQAENRYYHFLKRLGLTKLDAGVTGHGLRAEFAENLLLLRGLVPPSLGGAKAQLFKVDRDAILLEASHALGHGRPQVLSAYCGTFRNIVRSDGLGSRVGQVLIVDSDADVFALLYCHPAPVKLADGSYPVETAAERLATVTAVVESPGQPDEKVSIDVFVSRYPHLAAKVKKTLELAGLDG
jgi:site-specific recombinase XerC